MENYTSDSSDSDVNNGKKVLDFGFMMLEKEIVEHNLQVIADDEKKTAIEIESIILTHNRLDTLPENICKFSNLQLLDISNNGLNILPDIFEQCPLTTLIAKNNHFTNDSLPKSFTACPTLRELNLSGNHLMQFPEQLFDFVNLKYLYLGGNRINSVSRNIWKLAK